MTPGREEWSDEARASEFALIAQTCHKGTDMVRRHIRLGELCRDNAAEGLGL